MTVALLLCLINCIVIIIIIIIIIKHVCVDSDVYALDPGHPATNNQLVLISAYLSF